MYTKFRLKLQVFSVIFLALTVIPMTVEAKDKKILEGFVRSTDGVPISGATILISNEKIVGATDDEGRFSVTIPDECILTFQSIGSRSQSIAIKNQNTLIVMLEPSNVNLQEVQINQIINDKLTTEPTKIQTEKQFLFLNTRFKVPKSFFSPRTRLIIQPYVLDNSPDSVIYMLTPVVYDGKDFTIRQQRMYGDISRDPLSPYIMNPSQITDSHIAYRDSLEVESLDKNFHTYAKAFIETCCDIIYKDTILIAKGIVNPLRLISTNANPTLWMDEYAPERELMLRQENGLMDLLFATASADIDQNLGKNREEIQKIQDRITEIDKNPGSTLQVVELHGCASPDGLYRQNVALAKKRMDSALKLITSKISDQTRREIVIQSHSRVADWTEVAKLMKKDGHSEEATKIERLSKHYANKKDDLTGAITYLPYYKDLVTGYLPAFRQVQYKLNFALNREITDPEVIALFQSGQTNVTKFEFWRYYKIRCQDSSFLALSTNEQHKFQLEFIGRMQNLFPNSKWIANNMAVLNLLLEQPDERILQPYVDDPESPDELLANQVIILLARNKIDEAELLAERLNTVPRNNYIKSIVAIRQNKYQKALDLLENQNCLNKILLLLKLNKNDQAYRQARLLEDDSAVSYYVRAICANRLQMLTEAYDWLEKAFKKDPALKAIAEKDADINDLI